MDESHVHLVEWAPQTCAGNGGRIDKNLDSLPPAAERVALIVRVDEALILRGDDGLNSHRCLRSSSARASAPSRGGNPALSRATLGAENQSQFLSDAPRLEVPGFGRCSQKMVRSSGKISTGRRHTESRRCWPV